MNKLSLIMENCFGINKLEKDFDFSQRKAFIIYASNGTMKTSFAKSFSKYSIGEQIIEEVHGMKSKFSITKDDGIELEKEKIFVIKSYDEEYGSSKVSNLLADKKLQEQYQKAVSNIENQKQIFIDKVKLLIGTKVDVEEELTGTYETSKSQFLKLLEELYDSNILELECSGIDFNDVSYIKLFDKKVEEFANNPNNYKLLLEYANQYEALLSSSSFLEKGVFNHYNAEKVTENLNNNGFFDANHKVILKDGKTIKTAGEFQAILDEEKNKILSDKNLKTNFKKIDTALYKNAQMRDFRDIIEKDPTIIAKLVDFKKFKKESWIDILKNNIEYLSILIKEFKKESSNINRILKSASLQENDWRKVVDIFINRFHAPFNVLIDNQEEVVLKNSVPVFKFVYKDDKGETEIDRSKLISILSGGEKRSLYLMNIIFEIEAFKKENKPILIIADDIAESFDYRNKYAIIEYIKENVESGLFNFIILTHNFDFYRTISSRILGKKRNHCLMAVKQSDRLELKTGEYLGNIFENWKKNINKNDVILLACIPFVRNLIEYIHNENNEDYLTLTSLLHLKEFEHKYNSKEITFDTLQRIFECNWGVVNDFSSSRKNEIVYDKILSIATNISNSLTSETIDLEKKIVLSIGIRLMAEEYMINEIIKSGNFELIKRINSNQTYELLKLYKEYCITEKEILKILDDVLLMTSENIHLNSFMYEPLIDISVLHLKDLFENLLCLKNDKEQEAAITVK